LIPPLHLTSLFFILYHYYKDKVVQEDTSITATVIHCIDKFYPKKYDVKDKIGVEEFVAYKNVQGIMGSGVAKRY